MEYLDEIIEKLFSSGFQQFTAKVISYIRIQYDINQNDMAEKLGVKPIEISNVKYYSQRKREAKYDEILLRLIDEYRVPIDDFIKDINNGIEKKRRAELRRIEENNFELRVYLYDERRDIIYRWPIFLNLYKSNVKLINIHEDDVYSGSINQRTISLSNQKYRSKLQLILNGKKIESQIRRRHVISGIMTELNSANDGVRLMSLLITPKDKEEELDIAVKYFFNYKELQFGYISTAIGDFLKRIKRHKSHLREVTIKLPEELITGYKQFLDYFTDFVRYAKGQVIEFNIIKQKEALVIKIGTTRESSMKEVGRFLKEYLSFAKQNIDNLKVDIEAELSERDFNLLILDLKHQVTSLKHSLELAQLRNRMLIDQVDHLKTISSSFASKEQVIHTQIITGGDQQFANKIKNK